MKNKYTNNNNISMNRNVQSLQTCRLNIYRTTIIKNRATDEKKSSKSKTKARNKFLMSRQTGVVTYYFFGSPP